MATDPNAPAPLSKEWWEAKIHESMKQDVGAPAPAGNGPAAPAPDLDLPPPDAGKAPPPERH